MKGVRYFCFFLLFWGLLVPDGTAQEKEKKIQVNGYVKYLQTNNIGNDQLLTDNLLHNRLNIKWYPNDKLTFAVGMRNRLFYGEQVKTFNQLLGPFGISYGDLIDQYDGLVDLSIRWADGNAIVLHTIFDRAYLNWASDKWDIRVGRQRINWGINLAWNPNDIFNPLNFLDFDYEERPGRDAIRIQYYPGLMSSVELAVAPAKEIKESIAAALYKFNVGNYDIQILSGYSRGDFVMGTGWEGYIGGAGFKGELNTYRKTSLSTDTLGNAVAGSISFDYQFPATIYGNLSILYNQLGANSGENNLFGNATASLFLNNISAKNLFPGKWAGLLQLSGTPHPLVNVSYAMIYSPTDKLTIIFPTISYSIKENWDLDMIAQAAFGEQQESYQHLGTGLFFRIKWSY